MTREAAIVEPIVVPDTFVTDALPIQMMGDNIRLTLVVRERCHYDGSLQDAVAIKLVGSRADLLRIAATILKGCHSKPEPGERVLDTFLEFLEGPVERH